MIAYRAQLPCHGCLPWLLQKAGVGRGGLRFHGPQGVPVIGACQGNHLGRGEKDKTLTIGESKSIHQSTVICEWSEEKGSTSCHTKAQK